MEAAIKKKGVYCDTRYANLVFGIAKMQVSCNKRNTMYMKTGYRQFPSDNQTHYIKYFKNTMCEIERFR